MRKDRQMENEISREQVCWEALYDHLKEEAEPLLVTKTSVHFPPQEVFISCLTPLISTGEREQVAAYCQGFLESLTILGLFPSLCQEAS